VAKARVGIKLDRPGIAEIMKSAELASVLKDVANEVADTAGSDYTVVVDPDRRRTRVISMVIDNLGFSREAATGNLARAVGSKQTSWKR
jgi:hypothetical protein